MPGKASDAPNDKFYSLRPINQKVSTASFINLSNKPDKHTTRKLRGKEP
jgi:hypothetical protein